MSFLPGLLSIQVAAPLVALVALTLEAILLLRYRLHLNLKAVWPMTLASLIGVPIGVWGLQGIEEGFALMVLGVVLATYALYALLQLKMPELRNPLWGVGAGFLAGILGGAYNTSSPPVIVYSDCQRWQPAQFKANLQGFFLVSDFFIVATHAVSGNYNTVVWQSFLWSLPAIAAGVFVGVLLEQRSSPAFFRTAVLVLLIVMGVRLILSGLIS